ncbi:hypothetical protein [Rhizocola hellebori]|nr:hypothetical protein [Rhizocola hellebori]
MWTWVNRDLSPHYQQANSWKKTSELYGLYSSRLQTFRDRLAQVWNPKTSPAAEAYLTRLDELIVAVKNVDEVAGRNYQASVDIPNAISEAKYKLKPIYEEYRAAASTFVKEGGYNTQGSYANVSGSTTPEAKDAAELVNMKHYAAQSVMYKLSEDLSESRSRLGRPEPYTPPGVDATDDGNNIGGGGNTVAPPMIPPVIPTPAPAPMPTGPMAPMPAPKGPDLSGLQPTPTGPGPGYTPGPFTPPPTTTPTGPSPAPFPPTGVINPPGQGLPGSPPVAPRPGTGPLPGGLGGAPRPGTPTGIIGGTGGNPRGPAGVRGPNPPGGMIGGGGAGGRGPTAAGGVPGRGPAGAAGPGGPGGRGTPGAPGIGGTAARGGGAAGGVAGRGPASGAGGRGPAGTAGARGGTAGRAGVVGAMGVGGRGHGHDDEDGEHFDPDTAWEVAQGVTPVLDSPEYHRPIDPGPAIGLDR